MMNTGSTSPQRHLRDVTDTSICILNHLPREGAAESTKIRPNTNKPHPPTGSPPYKSRMLRNKIESHVHGVAPDHPGNDVASDSSAPAKIFVSTATSPLSEFLPSRAVSAEPFVKQKYSLANIVRTIAPPNQRVELGAQNGVGGGA